MPEGQYAALAVMVLAWLGWLALWIALSLGQKPAARHESRASRLVHLIPLGIGCVLLLGGPLTGPVLNAPILPRAAWMAYIGTLLVLAGLGFAIWARLHLGGNWSGLVTVKQSHELIQTGPYAMARHPIYTGLITAFTGTAIVEDAWRGPLAAVIIAASFIRKMRMEEAFMEATFGDAYARYRMRVPALWPRLK
jgi:protein-S-isoprenylcysteine O-methyltransferase Ste14